MTRQLRRLGLPRTSPFHQVRYRPCPGATGHPGRSRRTGQAGRSGCTCHRPRRRALLGVEKRVAEAVWMMPQSYLNSEQMFWSLLKQMIAHR